MLYCAQTDLHLNHPRLGTPLFRYELIERLWRAAKKQRVEIAAWGICGSELRAVMYGSDDAVKNVMRGVRVGTVRSAQRYGVCLRSGSSDRWLVSGVDIAPRIVWAHRGDRPNDADPLEERWTSHRDMMGIRHPVGWGCLMPRTLEQRMRIHVALGGGAWPSECTRRTPSGVQLGQLLRAASSVLGVLPGDRRGFRLFVHLARASGWTTRPIAGALCLTRRRVRQLAAETETLCDIAAYYLTDQRLMASV